MTSVLVASVAVSILVFALFTAGKVSKETVRSLGRKIPDLSKYRNEFNILGIEADLEWLMGLRIIAVVIMVGACVICIISQHLAGMLFLIGAMVSWKSLDMWLSKKEKQRQEQIEREFPLMVTLVRVYAQAADLYQALTIVRDALQGEMQRQVDILARELQISPLQTALENFAERCRYPLLSNFVTVVLFGIKTGADVDEILASFGRRAYEARVNNIKRKIKTQPVLMAVIPAVLALSLIMLFIFPLYSTIITRLQAF